MTAMPLTSVNASWCCPHTDSKVPGGDLLLNVKVTHTSILMLVLPVFVSTVHSSGLARRYAKEENRFNVYGYDKG